MVGWYHPLGHDVPEELIEQDANAYRRVATGSEPEFGSMSS